MKEFALQWFVEHAPTGSWRISWFAKLSEGAVSCPVLSAPPCQVYTMPLVAPSLACGLTCMCHAKQIECVMPSKSSRLALTEHQFA